MYEWCNKDICLFENDKAIEALNYLKKIMKKKKTGLAKLKKWKDKLF